MATTATFSTRNNYSGANFDYEHGLCVASGAFRLNESRLEEADINGSYTKDGETYAFTARRDNQGNVNIYNVHDYRVLAEVATEVAAIIAKIEALNANAE